MTNEIRKMCIKIVSQQLDVDVSQIKAESQFIDDLGADSLAIVELTIAAEEAFDIDISDEDVEKIRTVGDACSYIEQCLVGMPADRFRELYNELFEESPTEAYVPDPVAPENRYEGSYVHYKGGIYRAIGRVDDGANPGDANGASVLYENKEGRRFYRTVADFTQLVDPCTGEPTMDGIPRFQLIVGWNEGQPIVMADGEPILFVSEWEAP